MQKLTSYFRLCVHSIRWNLIKKLWNTAGEMRSYDRWGKFFKNNNPRLKIPSPIGLASRKVKVADVHFHRKKTYFRWLRLPQNAQSEGLIFATSIT
jgi:hypothetical protein